MTVPRQPTQSEIIRFEETATLLTERITLGLTTACGNDTN